MSKTLLFKGLGAPSSVLPTCVIGTPGISFPAGFSKDGLPIGMQFLGPRRSEKLLLKSAHAFESLTEYYKKVPKDYV